MFSKKIVKFSALAVVAVLFLTAAVIVTLRSFKSDQRNSYRFNSDFFAMDTIVSVRSQSDITSEVKEIFGQFQSALDCNDEKSETYLLNQNGLISASDTLCSTIESVMNLNEKYGNFTDITIGRLTALWNITAENPKVPQRSEIENALVTVGRENISVCGNNIFLSDGTALDFGAVGKGAALDACFDFLEKNKCEKTNISTGSSVLLYGNGSFSVGIADPAGGVLAEVRTEQCFLSTSGGYERYFKADGKTYCHIIDPKTGYPTDTDLTTVTVFCQNGIESDFLSTMIFLDGSENIEKYLNSTNYKIFAADSNKNLYISNGLDYEVYNESYGV